MCLETRRCRIDVATVKSQLKTKKYDAIRNISRVKKTRGQLA